MKNTDVTLAVSEGFRGHSMNLEAKFFQLGLSRHSLTLDMVSPNRVNPAQRIQRLIFWKTGEMHVVARSPNKPKSFKGGSDSMLELLPERSIAPARQAYTSQVDDVSLADSFLQQGWLRKFVKLRHKLMSDMQQL